MLRVNVGLSRKLSKDYNSTGYSINVEGEVTSPVTDPEAVTEEVKQLYDLAEEALAVQIERSRSEAALARHDEESHTQQASQGRGFNGRNENHRSGNGHQANQGGVPATNKQIQYLLSIGKRQRLSTVELEARIEEILGESVGVYDLTKRQAGTVIDELTGNDAAAASRSRR
ncbi:MAG: hypothetical protein DWQ35_13920 [Planctomycetota bacterium]|nr:MAG: hypothetical protein DWQ35_13920 [Planctomycetota bacterium]REK25959.1 MAG: hypothetical protein DWQ42_10035 [Planctomycetota bacterium]REK46925.1 MAG: hypothetical protein DWQ46_05365 [Planctomycetota bacterium]